ncbi:RsbT co-antagonist protein RsbRD, N-terminal domain [Syntrophomonas zehnderi OL-4]|uniref:RsbT co-antagonist protein RsbRD, N-terminal domain n=2 Tax=Syntrophomonas TaxID=862 RepID=A0A0E4C8W4_9FIRM|nr:RsbT co-antagonist protein RsbRD, N-terminal domain [Syntrophomonas zehnderi OL-4]
MELSIYTAISEKKPKILSKWQASASTSHAKQDPLIVNTKKGRFTNPMAYIIEKNAEEIFEWLIKPDDNLDLLTPLQEICKLRAIQDFKPAEALKFIFTLKQIIRDELAEGDQTNNWSIEIWDVDKRIDEIGLHAFDIYSDCQAKIYEIKMNEIKRLYGRDAG